MNWHKLQQFYYPILPIARLGIDPFAFKLFNQSLVLVRLDNQIRCFDDYCPHRHVPLSEGHSDGKFLHCFYHGWKFDANGKAFLPHCLGKAPDVQLGHHLCREEDSWIWVKLRTNQSENTFQLPEGWICPEGFSAHDSTHQLTGDLLHSIENFLDPTHTPYVHKTLLHNRGLQRMHISQTHHAHGFSTNYKLLEQQNGLINRLFDSGIDTNIAYFSLPTVAHIDYLKDEKLQYRIALVFVPSEVGQIHLSVRVVIPKGMMPSSIKFALLKPFVKALLRQDQAALLSHAKNKRFPEIPYRICANDLVIDHLLHLLADMPEGKDKSGLMEL